MGRYVRVLRWRHFCSSATSFVVFAAIVAATLAVVPTPALADAIDGEWCRGGDRLKIDGATISTPARNTVEGTYGRYRFAYTVPANEPGAGGEIRMVMIRGQGVVHLERPGATSGSHEVWQRCVPIS